MSFIAQNKNKRMPWHKPQYIIHWEYVCYASLPTVQSRVSGVHSYCSECTVDNCLPKFVVTTIRECVTVRRLNLLFSECCWLKSAGLRLCSAAAAAARFCDDRRHCCKYGNVS